VPQPSASASGRPSASPDAPIVFAHARAHRPHHSASRLTITVHAQPSPVRPIVTGSPADSRAYDLIDDAMDYFQHGTGSPAHPRAYGSSRTPSTTPLHAVGLAPSSRAPGMSSIRR
jgi:hypothetical protein